jgi:alkylation response protein AidB-like acyl-CoA dehydrogenase
MDFGLSPEQQQLRAAIIAFAESELNNRVRARDHASEFDADAWRRCAAQGLLGLRMPAELGGGGKDTVTTVIALEALGYGCRDNGLTLAIPGQMWSIQEPLLAFGDSEQKQRFMPGLCDGSTPGAHAMTEPDTGSDAFACATTAQREGDYYRINGHKTMIGLAPVCGVALVFASTNPAHGQWGLSAFLVEADTPGMECQAGSEKMGLRTAPLGDIRFQDCLVPAANRLGPEGAGQSIFNHSMDWERSFIFACHLGAMQAQLEAATRYAHKRRQFGQAVADFQSVSNRLAEMRLRLETCQLLLYKAAWLKDQGQTIPMHAALTKLHLGESLLASSLDAMRIHGGQGFMTEFEVERSVRDHAGGVIYSGTSDIQRQLIAKMLPVEQR